MDIHQREGNYPPPPGWSDILGVEFSGIVAELGPDVTDWHVGDEVLGLAGGVCTLHANTHRCTVESNVASDRALMPSTSSYPRSFSSGSRRISHG
jgi:NADPH:quinone reductase-like Zn-dependent oxidoreductase